MFRFLKINFNTKNPTEIMKHLLYLSSGILSGFLLLSTSGCRDKEYAEPSKKSELATLHIQIQNRQTIEKNNYVPASISFFPGIDDMGDRIENYSGNIKGRGNSTWTMIKKPYKLKMDQKTSFFGMAPAKKWVLLANYADKTLIRNYLAYWLADRIGSPHAPSFHFLEVYLNEVYQGNYMMSDQIETGTSRVNIPELKPEDNAPQMITGGYLLEIDQRVTETGDPYFRAHQFPVGIKSPDEPSEEQLSYISGYVNEAEDVLYSSNFTNPETGFRKYFDDESMIQWFIVSEIFKNVDSRDFSSIFFFKDRGGKLVMGPVWDFDLSAGNATYCDECMDPEGWYVLHSYWFERMWQDRAFREKVKQRWQEYKPEIESLFLKIEDLSNQLALSQNENFKLWPDFDDPDWAVVQGLESYNKQIDYLRDFLRKRIDWMNSQLSD